MSFVIVLELRNKLLFMRTRTSKSQQGFCRIGFPGYIWLGLVINRFINVVNTNKVWSNLLIHVFFSFSIIDFIPTNFWRGRKYVIITI